MVIKIRAGEDPDEFSGKRLRKTKGKEEYGNSSEDESKFLSGKADSVCGRELRRVGARDLARLRRKRAAVGSFRPIAQRKRKPHRETPCVRRKSRYNGEFEGICREITHKSHKWAEKASNES